MKNSQKNKESKTNSTKVTDEGKFPSYAEIEVEKLKNKR
jgi:hypothetical protein